MHAFISCISSFPAHEINMVVTCDQYQHKTLSLQCLCAVCRHLCQRNMEDDIKNSQETGRLPTEVLTKNSNKYFVYLIGTTSQTRRSYRELGQEDFMT